MPGLSTEQVKYLIAVIKKKNLLVALSACHKYGEILTESVRKLKTKLCYYVIIMSRGSGYVSIEG